MGRGLTPADFTAYSQRYRWAFGAMQILKARWDWLTERAAGGASVSTSSPLVLVRRCAAPGFTVLR
jgi:hypothetical protein